MLPESMSRIVIVGSKSRLSETVEAMYRLKLVHLIDHTVDSDEGFSIGAPQAGGAKSSERLLVVRAVEKELGINEKIPMDAVSVEDIQKQISSSCVESVEEEVFAVLDRKNEIAQKISDLKARKKDLEALASISIDLEMYAGYRSIVALVGSVRADPSQALKNIPDSESLLSKDKKTLAVFVKKENKEVALKALSDFGYSEIGIPAGSGSPADAIVVCEAETKTLATEMDTVNAEIAQLKEKHQSFLRGADEQLCIDVEKDDLPLRMGISSHSFVVDAWIPTKKIDKVTSELNSMMGDNVYIEVQETRSRKLHDADHAEERFKTTPTKWKNGRYAKRFEYPVSLVSTPKYQEIDPSAILAVFFPFFFGLMVGDVGYAIPFIILGLYGMLTAKSKDFQAIATVLFFGGIWAFIFGFFMFGEMLGMHFIGPGDGLQRTWETLLNVNLPEWFAGCMPYGHGVSKLVQVTFLLKLSVYIGIVHLMVGYITGFINVVIQHGAKDAFFEKGGWIISFIGMVILCWSLAELLIYSKPLEGTLLYVLIGSVAVLIVGIAVTYTREKAQAVLELPGIVGNILSYTRLAAIGMSKAGMALAFNYLSIIMMVEMMPGIAGWIVGFLIFLVGHLMIWTLAILSAGLHGLRLQYVEMMTKFFVGGGKEYSPLSEKRKNTKIVETEV